MKNKQYFYVKLGTKQTINMTSQKCFENMFIKYKEQSKRNLKSKTNDNSANIE